MEGYWITFEDGTQGYCEGANAFHALQIAEHLTKKKVKLKDGDSKWSPTIPRLPYPAQPIIWQFDDPVVGKCPAFCYRPLKCCGRTACPTNPACTE